ncbi:Hypothetical protein PHPALM_137 [Phytophthora palmivora]|uniref:SWIM-type domain-containing protein n=1 Tax=Phytophthora palmivora TaxID=4796 RepID=A0A2P4YVM3_9STRA|nr:Hypothetical protein PHPALM_137 [Phytophthora palmivora]
MIQRLDRSRLVFMQITFRMAPVASERLKSLYNLAERKKELEAIPFLAASDLPQNIPEGGWLVDARTCLCPCRFNAKFAICIHFIHSTKELELPCTGMSDPVPTFVSNQRRSGSETTQSSSKQRVNAQT